MKSFLPFKEARAYIWELNFLSTNEYDEWLDAKKRPKNIPRCPQDIYRNEFISLRNWLGNDWISFEESKAYMAEEESQIKTSKDYFKWAASDQRPVVIPSRPQILYSEDWVSWSDFLGAPSREKNYISFNEARAFIRKQKIRTQAEWLEWYKKNNPTDIPANPQTIYNEWHLTGWMGWRDWLGPRLKYINYEQLKKLIKGKKLRNSTDFNKWRKKNKSYRNQDGSMIPSKPEIRYKEWKGWNSFLNPPPKKSQFLTFKQARKEVRKLKLNIYRDWMSYCRSGKRPKNIPSNPVKYYKDEFTDWPDFLGAKL